MFSHGIGNEYPNECNLTGCNKYANSDDKIGQKPDEFLRTIAKGKSHVFSPDVHFKRE